MVAWSRGSKPSGFTSVVCPTDSWRGSATCPGQAVRHRGPRPGRRADPHVRRPPGRPDAARGGRGPAASEASSSGTGTTTRCRSWNGWASRRRAEPFGSASVTTIRPPRSNESWRRWPRSPAEPCPGTFVNGSGDAYETARIHPSSTAVPDPAAAKRLRSVRARSRFRNSWARQMTWVSSLTWPSIVATSMRLGQISAWMTAGSPGEAPGLSPRTARPC